MLCPIPIDHLNRDCFEVSDQPRIDALFADLDFTEAASRREQIAVACKHLCEFEGASRLTFDAIGRLFHLKGPSIEAQWKRSQKAVRELGRPPLFPPEVQEWTSHLITARFREHNPITYAELLDTLQYTREITLSGDSLRHIVRGMPTVKSVIGIPTESERVAVDPEQIDAWLTKLEEKVQGIPRAFVFNVDETGCSEYSDSRKVRALVPIDYPAPSVPVPVNRHSKRSTLTACIAADGFRARPFLIVSRITAENKRRLDGYDQNNAFIASRENAFMTRSLFELWATEVFFPMVEQRRMERNSQGKILLLMDGLGSHHTDRFLEQCTERAVDVLFLVPHALDQTQPLDLLTFALMKQRYSASKFQRLANPQSNQVVRVLGAWFAASNPHHNVEAFMSLSLFPSEASGDIFLIVDREKARRVRGWHRTDDWIPRVQLPPEARRRTLLPTGV
jgi:hypothetical protein